MRQSNSTPAGIAPRALELSISATHIFHITLLLGFIGASYLCFHLLAGPKAKKARIAEDRMRRKIEQTEWRLYGAGYVDHESERRRLFALKAMVWRLDLRLERKQLLHDRLDRMEADFAAREELIEYVKLWAGRYRRRHGLAWVEALLEEMRGWGLTNLDGEQLRELQRRLER